MISLTPSPNTASWEDVKQLIYELLNGQDDDDTRPTRTTTPSLMSPSSSVFGSASENVESPTAPRAMRQVKVPGAPLGPRAWRDANTNIADMFPGVPAGPRSLRDSNRPAFSNGPSTTPSIPPTMKPTTCLQKLSMLKAGHLRTAASPKGITKNKKIEGKAKGFGKGREVGTEVVVGVGTRPKALGRQNEEWFASKGPKIVGKQNVWSEKEKELGPPGGKYVVRRTGNGMRPLDKHKDDARASNLEEWKRRVYGEDGMPKDHVK